VTLVCIFQEFRSVKRMLKVRRLLEKFKSLAPCWIISSEQEMNGGSALGQLEVEEGGGDVE